MPTILHSSDGLTIKRNDSNTFVVARLHYSADPAKRSPEWRAEAAAGMTPEKFAREYNIDYTAVLGSKVFPEFGTLKHNIVICAPHPDFGPSARYWGGFDYGSQNPASFHVYTISDDTIYCVFEIYHPCKNIPAFAAQMQEFPYWRSIRYIAADPQIWTPTQQQDIGNLISVQDHFYREGVRNMMKGRNDPAAEDAWIAMLHKMWDVEEPSFRIFDTCPNLINEFENCVYVGQSERQLLTSAYQEKIANVNNHALDDCKYFLLSQPPRQAPKPWQQSRMIDKWSVPGAGQGAGSRPGTMPQKSDRGYLVNTYF